MAVQTCKNFAGQPTYYNAPHEWSNLPITWRTLAVSAIMATISTMYGRFAVIAIEPNTSQKLYQVEGEHDDDSNRNTAANPA